MRPMWPGTKGSYHAKMHEQDPNEGLLMQVTASLGCASHGKMQCYGAGMQAMQDREKNFNRGLGWAGEICTVDAEGVKPAKTGI